MWQRHWTPCSYSVNLLEQTIQLHPLELLVLQLIRLVKKFHFVQNQGRYIAGEKSALFGDLPVSHLHFWGLPLVYFLESESQPGDCISWWKATLSAMLRPCINSVKSHSVSQTPQSELVLCQCCSQGWAWLNFLKQMTLFWKVFPVLTKQHWITTDQVCGMVSSQLNLIWPLIPLQSLSLNVTLELLPTSWSVKDTFLFSANE